jgi:hypothetical protein
MGKVKRIIAAAVLSLALTNLAHAETLKGDLKPVASTCGPIRKVRNARLTIGPDAAVLATKGEALELQRLAANAYIGFTSTDDYTEVGVQPSGRRKAAVTVVNTYGTGVIGEEKGDCQEAWRGTFRR